MLASFLSLRAVGSQLMPTSRPVALRRATDDPTRPRWWLRTTVMVPRNGKIALGRCCSPRSEDDDRSGLLGQSVDARRTVAVAVPAAEREK